MASNQSLRRDKAPLLEKNPNPKSKTDSKSPRDTPERERNQPENPESKPISDRPKESSTEKGRGDSETKMSLQEISEHRAKAQQSSMDAIRGAEERYFGKIGEVGRSTAAKAGDAAAQVKETAAGTGIRATAGAEEAAKTAAEKAAEIAKSVEAAVPGGAGEETEGEKGKKNGGKREMEPMELAEEEEIRGRGSDSVRGEILEAIGETILEIAQIAESFFSLGIMNHEKKKPSQERAQGA